MKSRSFVIYAQGSSISMCNLIFENKNEVSVTYGKIKLIYSMRFMKSSLLNFADNLAEGLGNIIQKDFKYYLEYVNVACLTCNKNYEKDFNKNLAKRLANTYKFCNEDINKFSCMIGITNTRIIVRDLMKHHYQIKKITLS